MLRMLTARARGSARRRPVPGDERRRRACDAVASSLLRYELALPRAAGEPNAPLRHSCRVRADAGPDNAGALLPLPLRVSKHAPRPQALSDDCSSVAGDSATARRPLRRTETSRLSGSEPARAFGHGRLFAAVDGPPGSDRWKGLRGRLLCGLYWVLRSPLKKHGGRLCGSNSWPACARRPSAVRALTQVQGPSTRYAR